MNCACSRPNVDYEELIARHKAYTEKQRILDYGERLRAIARETTDMEQREVILELAKRYDEPTGT